MFADVFRSGYASWPIQEKGSVLRTFIDAMWAMLRGPRLAEGWSRKARSKAQLVAIQPCLTTSLSKKLRAQSRTVTCEMRRGLSLVPIGGLSKLVQGVGGGHDVEMLLTNL
jgi:hypothetical protein